MMIFHIKITLWEEDSLLVLIRNWNIDRTHRNVVVFEFYNPSCFESITPRSPFSFVPISSKGRLV